MVVMGARKNPLARGAGSGWDGRNHVAIDPLAVEHTGLHPDLDAWQYETARRVRVFLVEFGLRLLQRLAHRGEKDIGHLQAH